jgi:large subunit ribosomal protein L33
MVVGRRAAENPLPNRPTAAIVTFYHVRGRVMAKGKEARGIIKLVSSESTHCYFTQKNRNNTKERIQLKKYDPILRKRVMYKEAGKL